MTRSWMHDTDVVHKIFDIRPDFKHSNQAMHRLHTVTLPDGTVAKKSVPMHTISRGAPGNTGRVYTHVVITRELPVDDRGVIVSFDSSRAMWRVAHWCGSHERALETATRAMRPEHVLMTDVLPVTTTVQGQ